MVGAALEVILVGLLPVAAVLGLALRRWKNSLSKLELGLSPQPDAGSPVRLPTVGEPDLDKIVDAFNAYVTRAESLQQRAVALSDQLMQAERFSSLGRLAAQVPHEIRNPLGAVRLKAKKPLSGAGKRQR